MPPAGRSRGTFRGRGRGSSGRGSRGGRGRQSDHRRSNFRTSRIQEERDDTASSTNENDEVSGEDGPANGLSDQDSVSDENPDNQGSSYGQLLQLLDPGPRTLGRAVKKRKLVDGSGEPIVGSRSTYQVTERAQRDNLSGEVVNETTEIDGLESDVDEAETDGHAVSGEQDEDDTEEADRTDPFESHFAMPDSKALSEGVKAINDITWVSHSITTSQGVKQHYSVPASGSSEAKDTHRIRAVEGLKLKRRLITSGQEVWEALETQERDVASAISTYRDTLFGSRTIDNIPRLRDFTVLHALNHVFKTRDRVIKNNSKLAQETDGEGFELRDQGFTRPKVLFILPTKQACVKVIDSMVKLAQPEQQENKSRFIESFVQEDDDSWEDKPRDFQELFSGNDDDMFRIGLKFTRKTVKFFSAFYNSDVILASPLGLRTAIESGGLKEGKKSSDADFLSSIEVVIMDHANALLMQNWQHVEHVFSQLNLLPKESHGCDFSRVRHWYLDGLARYIRQTIVLTDFITPEINAIYTKFMLNVAGKFRYAPTYKGAIIDASTSLPISISQTFLRLHAPTPVSDADARFSYFTSSILPSLLKSKQNIGTLIFMSSYLDFVRVRNHFSTSTSTASLSFGAISEYTSVRDVARARSHLLTGRQSILLYSERAHHFRRYNLKGVKRVVFYSLPVNPIFWTEVVRLLGPEDSGSTDRARRSVRALFSRWDALKLERIVGTSRVSKMVNEKAGDTFEFI